MVGTGQFWLGARADYAIRALALLAIAVEPLTAEQIAQARQIPKTFLTVILSQLGRAGLVHSRRGRIGGYSLALAPAEISIAEIVAAVGEHTLEPPPSTEDPYQRLQGRLFGVIDTVTLADLIANEVEPTS
ncbi:MAG: RrF2 family transcriptional regulator [Actinomycetes bacterium]